MRRIDLVAAAVVALGWVAIIASSAEAQATASASPFHAGQWGVEAYASGSGGGIVRFFTPRTALALTLTARHLSTKSNDPSSTLLSSKSSLFDATLGFRRHSVLAPRMLGTFGAGAVGGTLQQRQEYVGVFSPNRYHASYYGAYAEGGAQYMVADHFAVGVAYRFTLSHTRNDGTHQTGAEMLAAILPVRATLYF